MKRAFTKRLSLTARKLRKSRKLSKDKTTVNVHGWYIITSRGLSYICDIPRKEQYIPIAWASALSVSTVGQCEGLEGEMGKGQDSHAFFLCSLITNRKHQGNWDIA